MISRIIEKAKELGFMGVGFSVPEKPLFFESFNAWLSNKKYADMSWMEKNIELRQDPTRLLGGCRTIISLAYPYPSQKSYTVDGFSVSRYSQPRKEDYHFRLKTLCRELVGLIKENFSKSSSRICVDSAPILERSFAYSSGIGFWGKNNMLVIPGYGSYFYLAEILTSVPLQVPEIDPMESKCGSCTSCIDSCPTGALCKPYDMDASRCLSYLTIESKEVVNSEAGARMDDCFFGCDRCQEVCPFNIVEKSREIVLPETEELLQMTDEDFKGAFGSTALARAGLEKIKSNISAVKKIIKIENVD
ncbi:tRNA epoxyqueuosine(34) reductase QueG [Thermodesulfobacteriota bacterium]